MKIGGLQKVTLLDFPAQIGAIVFTKGCNFRCPFCFNRDLVLDKTPTVSQSTILAFLKKRKGILDGVVLTGGEPLLQENLEQFIKKVRRLGFKVKLDTNGTSPDLLKDLLERKLVDYVALDYKAPLDKSYAQAIGKKEFDFRIINQSIKILLKSKTPFELRTTIVPGIHDQKKLVKMARQLKGLLGKKRPSWYWQNFQAKNCLKRDFEKIKPYTKIGLERFLVAAKRNYPEIKLRPS